MFTIAHRSVIPAKAGTQKIITDLHLRTTFWVANQIGNDDSRVILLKKMLFPMCRGFSTVSQVGDDNLGSLASLVKCSTSRAFSKNLFVGLKATLLCNTFQQ